MKTDAISRIFSSLTQKYPVSSEQKGPKVQDAVPQALQGEAARVSSDLGLEAGDKGARSEKVERLKNEINAGTYNPDSREVATAVLKELGSL